MQPSNNQNNLIMSKHVLFIQGGGEDGYNSDTVLAASLQKTLGKDYDVSYPKLHTDERVADFGWPGQIGQKISGIKGEGLIVGHSLGASMILKFISENKMKEKLAGIFLISTPFWKGDEDWKQGLKLNKNFADKLPKSIPIFLYHCRDDKEVAFSDLNLYREKLTVATFRDIPTGGHQFNNDLTIVANDIKSLSSDKPVTV
jgi:predicted alpha/beta hydrolase family esterase